MSATEKLAQQLNISKVCAYEIIVAEHESKNFKEDYVELQINLDDSTQKRLDEIKTTLKVSIDAVVAGMLKNQLNSVGTTFED